MLKQRLILCALAGALALILAGCGDGKVQSTVSEVVSKIGDDISGTVSRAESMLDNYTSSGIDMDSSSMVSNPDYASSGSDREYGSSGVNSGDWNSDPNGLNSDLNGLNSDLGNLDSDLADDGVVNGEDNSSFIRER